MKNRRPSRPFFRKQRSRGFSLVEVLIATVILLIGLVGVAQLVPASILINQKGRMDSTSLVFAQRELDQMLAQKLTATSFLEANNIACQGAFCGLGDPTNPGVVVGNPVIWVGNRPLIDFSGAPQDNYSFSYTDPNDPFKVTYDVRWGVITLVNNGTVSGKRFFVGVRQLGGQGFIPAVTLDAMVGR